MIETLSDIKLELITDPYAKSVLQLCLNVIDSQQQQIKELKELVQSLKDEISKLKGEQPKPEFKPKIENKNISSQKYINPKKKHQKKSKKNIIQIDKNIICQINPAILPTDAVFKGYDTLIQQDIIFKRENTQFSVELWYSPSLRKTFRADTPEYEGYFGNRLKSFCIVMNKDIDVTHSKLARIFKYLGIEISAGSIQNILIENPQMWINEKTDILIAGLQGIYTQTDTTSAKVAGELYRTHIICSQWFVIFSTLEGKGRKQLLYALQGDPPSGLMMVYNQTTLEYLQYFKISQACICELKQIFDGLLPICELEFKQTISRQIPEIVAKPTIFNWICDAFAFGYYYHQQEFSQVKVLISDDAPEYKLVGQEHGLCWVHDARYYNKLTPFIDCHKNILSDFKERYWLFYDTLLEYQKNPTAVQKQKIEQDFDTLFVPSTSYFDLNKVINRTRNDKNKLLTVLEYPQIPLHNNRSELAARQQVRRRDICLHTMTRLGTQLQDAFMSIICTCNLLGLNAFTYIMDRIAGKNQFYLPNLVLINVINSS